MSGVRTASVSSLVFSLVYLIESNLIQAGMFPNLLNGDPQGLADMLGLLGEGSDMDDDDLPSVRCCSAAFAFSCRS